MYIKDINDTKKKIEMTVEEYNYTKDPYWLQQKQYYEQELNNLIKSQKQVLSTLNDTELRDLVEKNLKLFEKTKNKNYLEQAKITMEIVKENTKREMLDVQTLRKPIQEIFKEGLLDDLTPKPLARQKIIQMPIRDFLDLATPLDKEHSSRAREAFQKGIRWSDLPFLQFDEHDNETQKVFGHEGRHRAKVLQEQGYTHMPVELRSRGIRWSEQMNPNSYDYVQNFPKYLMQEQGSKKIPFPFTREEAPLPPKSLEQSYKNLTQDSTEDVTKSLLKNVKPTQLFGLNPMGLLMSIANFFDNPMEVGNAKADIRAGQRIKQKQEMNKQFIEPKAIKNDTLYKSYLNSRNRQA